MVEISRASLFGKLNKTGYRAIESATVFCKLRGNPEVELAHWIHQLLQLMDSDLHRIIAHFGIDASKVAGDLTDSLDRLPRGATTISDISADVEEAVERGWVLATLMFGETQVRTGHLVLAALRLRHLRRALCGLSAAFADIGVDALARDFGTIVEGSPERDQSAVQGGRSGAVDPGEASGAIAPAQMGQQQALAQFTIDLTARARRGRIDPIVGRDSETRQVVDILMRRRQNNPMLVGEAGVGKTAVVEGFALRIADGDVPPPLKDVELRTLDVGLLQAGASMKGEFENRLKQVIEEVQASPRPIILFIDEAHTLVGAGGAAGTGDAANLLKPALARGDLRTIGATTWAEYKKHIEKDPALTRRFQTVQVEEPSEQKGLLMLRGIAGMLERHHQVQILDEALDAAVRLSHRYIPARQLPDKAISLLDTACARVAIGQHAVPAEVDDTRKRIQALETELAIIGREKSLGIEVAEREQVADKALADQQERLATLETTWAEEKSLVERILELRGVLRDAGRPADQGDAPEAPEAANGDGEAIEAQATAAATAAPDHDATRAELKRLQTALSLLQGESPLILPGVDYQAVAAVVADWTGIPVGRMVRSELETVMNLAELMARRVIGQDHAMAAIASRVQTSRAGLDNPDKPIGVFLLAGTSGVGKTETALALAEVLYGGEHNLITINMSEFQEAHTVSTLKGAPPGYVGYGEGGVLTEAVRRRPYSVVLMDEVEKAHPDVHEIFFQVFDKGWMEDGEGRRIDFRNTLILLTTNVGTDLISTLCKDEDLLPDPESLADAVRPVLLESFPPALLGRLVSIPYYPLTPALLGEITRLQIERIRRRVQEQHRIAFDYTPSVVELVVGRCTESESGGRMIDAILTNTMLPAVSRELLMRTIEGSPISGIRVDTQSGDFSYAFVPETTKRDAPSPALVLADGTNG
ncbi:type VI secretion system ATPase TssH [Luteimonas abyssi]|uniref:type VI secretion system ATPase TssH n=1 Tax=Luteimonas abyssi TaxID=1247514 RepID=UPI0009EA56C1|nr:type VI secretion system ATPase TssH [Luteimonas abyssi]